jgi:hypothetical protein
MNINKIAGKIAEEIVIDGFIKDIERISYVEEVEPSTNNKGFTVYVKAKDTGRSNYDRVDGFFSQVYPSVSEKQVSKDVRKTFKKHFGKQMKLRLVSGYFDVDPAFGDYSDRETRSLNFSIK